MSFSNCSKLKKDADTRPYSVNPIYQTPITSKCGYCKSPGRKKIYLTLWNLRWHTVHNHPMEFYDNKFQDYAQRIIRGEASF